MRHDMRHGKRHDVKSGKRRDVKSGKRRDVKSGKRRGTRSARTGENGSRTRSVRISTACTHVGGKLASAATMTMPNGCSATCERSWNGTRSHARCGLKK
jgi:hypothetical protein